MAHPRTTRASGAAVASKLGLSIYPAKGQSKEQQAQAQAAQISGTFAKAMSACLTGKGYTVN